QNCLVNAMCLGIAPHERLTKSAAAGVGNHVVLLGALTGRDGIGGASVLASAELGEGDEAKRPSVQIGDPFEEKKLIECCLELLDQVLAVCEKWEVRASAVGSVTEGNRLRVFHGDELVGDMPVDVLVDDCPLYDLEPEKPASPVYAPGPARIGADDNPLLALLA